MVQKGGFNRKLDILINFGTQNFRFLRIKKVFKKQVDNFFSPNQFIQKIKTSQKIITHAGPGNLYLISKFARYMPLIVPRRKKFKEHVDDHQFFFAQYIKNKLPKKYQKYIVLEEKIDQIIMNYLNEKPVKNILKKYIFKANNKQKINARKRFKKLLNYLLR